MKRFATLIFTAIIALASIFFVSSRAEAAPSLPASVQVVRQTKRISRKVYYKGRWVTKTTWHHGKRISKRVWVKGNQIGNKVGRKTKEIFVGKKRAN